MGSSAPPPHQKKKKSVERRAGMDENTGVNKTFLILWRDLRLRRELQVGKTGKKKARPTAIPDVFVEYYVINFNFIGIVHSTLPRLLPYLARFVLRH